MDTTEEEQTTPTPTPAPAGKPSPVIENLSANYDSSTYTLAVTFNLIFNGDLPADFFICTADRHSTIVTVMPVLGYNGMLQQVGYDAVRLVSTNDYEISEGQEGITAAVRVAFSCLDNESNPTTLATVAEDGDYIVYVTIPESDEFAAAVATYSPIPS